MRLLEKRTDVEDEIMKMYFPFIKKSAQLSVKTVGAEQPVACIQKRRNKMKDNYLRIHENNSSILSGRAGAGQQLATSYRWFAVFLLVSPSFSVLSLPLSS